MKPDQIIDWVEKKVPEDWSIDVYDIIEKIQERQEW
jgi:hypothetical protein